MRIAIVAVAVLAIGVLTAAPTVGQVFFEAPIDGLQQVPPNASPGTGLGCLTLHTDGRLTYNIVYSGLLFAEVAAHFHGPAPAGVNAGVQIGLPATPFSKTGTVGPLTGAQQADLLNNLWYINIHTLNLLGGELRGQIILGTGIRCTVPVEEGTWGHIKELYRAEG